MSSILSSMLKAVVLYISKLFNYDVFGLLKVEEEKDRLERLTYRKNISYVNLFDQSIGLKSDAVDCVPGPFVSIALPNSCVLSVVSYTNMAAFRSGNGAIVCPCDTFEAPAFDELELHGGGPRLKGDRENIEYIKYEGGKMFCPIGESRMIGPNKYGSLGVQYIIHTASPRFWRGRTNFAFEYGQLAKAYNSALACAESAHVKQVALPFLPASRYYRGDISDVPLAEATAKTIKNWASNNKTEIKDIVFFASDQLEVTALVSAFNIVFQGCFMISKL